MQDTVTRYLAGMSNAIDRNQIGPVILAIVDRLNSQAFNAAGLAIGTTNTTIKSANTVKYTANGVYVALAAADPIVTLTTAANISANKYNVVCIYGDGSGTVTWKMGTEGSSVGTVLFPTPPQGKASIGFVMITNGASAFTGGSTALTGGTATVTYTDTIGATDPSLDI